MANVPKTIQELQEYCKGKGMPLRKMRFFIGEDFKEPKAFGIYQDGDRYVVYKNKANGSRAVRYHGPDEAYAVKELYLKLMSECHNRGIYPDFEPGEEEEPGYPQTRSAVTRQKRPRLTEKEKAQRRKDNRSVLKSMGIYALQCLVLLAGVFLLVWLLTTFVFTGHKNDGYYASGKNMYYRYGDTWYINTDTTSYWHKSTEPEEDYEDWYLGRDYQEDWEVSDFKESQAWDSIQAENNNNSSYSSDYDSWDYNDTDWSSDW